MSNVCGFADWSVCFYVFFPWIRFLTSARFWFIIFILCWLSPWLATRNFASHNVSQKLSIYFGFVQKWVVVFFLGNSLSTTSQFQCSAFFYHRKSVIHFVFVICNHAVCISIKWWTKKSNRIKRTPHSYTEPHTHTQTPNEPKAKTRRVRKMPKGKGGCKSKIKGLQFLFVFLCARLALFRWISLFSVWWLCPLCLCNGNRLSVYV